MQFIKEERKAKLAKRLERLLKERDDVYNRSDEDWYDCDVDAIDLKCVRYIETHTSALRGPEMAAV